MAKKRSSKYLESVAKIDSTKLYPVKDAVKASLDAAYANFDETVEVAFRLGVDPRHADQMIRGAASLPNGTGKTTRVVVITSGDKIELAEKAGADLAGGDDVIAKIQGGWMEFDRVIASPEMMGKVGRVARVLGPRGLMPNPKLGTVTPNIENAVKEQKAGKVQYRTEKTGIIHLPIGKKSFGAEKLMENLQAVCSLIVKAKPASAKGTYVKSVTLSTSMGPGVKCDTSEILSMGER